MKVGWLRDAAEGYPYFPARSSIHGDVRSNSLIPLSEDHVKLIDVQGCSIDGGPAGSCNG